MEEFKYILILLSCAVLMIALCKKINLPSTIGYLLVGIIVGPGGLKWIPSLEKMHFLAEFGIVFLMFTLGLEISLPRLFFARRQIFVIGFLQVIICTLIAYAIGLCFGLDHKQSFIIGTVLSLSSTAVVIKQLREQKEIAAMHGSLSINILLFQDIAAVLLLIIIPAMTMASHNFLPITFLITFIKGIGVLIIMSLAGLWILRPLFHFVAKSRSTELFMLATLLVALSAAGITHSIHFSMGLGAFVAGLMLGETEFRHQIELDIRPFRNVFLGLFFIVIGAYLELNMLPLNWHYVLIILLTLVFCKTIAIMLLTMLFGTKNKTNAFRTGFILAHGGEFSFVVLTVAIQNNLISAEQRSAIFSALVASIMLAPLMIRYNKKISRKLFKENKIKKKSYNEYNLSLQAKEIKNHVILCGFGRVGQILARFLDQENIPWIALDLDPMRIHKAFTAGEKAFYGDATNPAILAEAGLSKARMVAISFADDPSALEILIHIRSLRLDVPVFIRTLDDVNLSKFQKEKATEVVPDTLEGSLMLASHLLSSLGIPSSKILSKIRKVQANRYEIMRGIYKGIDEINTLEDEINARRSLHSIVVSNESKYIDKRLTELIPNNKEENGPIIKTVFRDEKHFHSPSLNMKIKASDVLVFFATPEENYVFEEKINK